jgi:hypothetical protein
MQKKKKKNLAILLFDFFVDNNNKQIQKVKVDYANGFGVFAQGETIREKANGVFGTLGQFLTADGTGKAAWLNNYYYGAAPPENPNFGDIWFYLDDSQNPPTALLYMWVTDGVSNFFYDFLPPNFQNIY